MRDIKEDIGLEAARLLIGAKIRRADREDGVFGAEFTVRSVTYDNEGSLEFEGHCTEGRERLAWIVPPGCDGHMQWIRVLEEPPGASESSEDPPKEETPAERVARLRSELEDAERELERGGLPEGFDLCEDDDTEWTYPNKWGNQKDPHIGFDVNQDVYLGNTDSNGMYGLARIRFSDLVAWVDYIREKGLAPE